jgi:hypothetical protein
MSSERLDLDVVRGTGELLRATLTLFARHSGLFVSITLLVVAPVTILVNGVWERGLTSGPRPATGSLAAVLGAAIATFAMPVLVTALHAAVVRTMGTGRVPDVGEALRSAAPRFLPAVGAVLWYTVMGAVGLVLLVVPGVWTLVAGYFAAQIAVLERASPFDAVTRSFALVRGRWWETAGTLLAGLLVSTVAFYPLDYAIGRLHPGALYISLLTLVTGLRLSLSALFGTLFYFSLGARDREQSPLVAA